MIFDYSFITLVIIAIAAFFAGIVNAVAGGGTLITYPVLTAFGIPPVFANVTNTIALCPGYFGGTIAQSSDLRDQRKRLFVLVPTAIAGGITGGMFLLYTDEKIFTQLVPYLILFASLLLLVQEKLKKFLKKIRTKNHSKVRNNLYIILPVFAGTIYGGYFGAGLGVILLAVLALVLDDSLIRINALKQTLSLSTNIAAAIFFIFSDKVIWPVVLIMAVTAYVGGVTGSKIAGRVNPSIFRWIVVCIGIIIGFIYLLK